MIPFSGFLILAMILFGTTFWQLNTTSSDLEDVFDSEGNVLLNKDGTNHQQYNNIEKRPITKAILYMYLLTFGEFDMDGFDSDAYGERWILFILGTILLQLVMLNLVIAIMSDTFARVMSEIEISDGMELNNLIIESEKLKIRNRNKKARHVLHWVEYKTEQGAWGGGNQEIVSAITASSETLSKALKSQSQAVRNLQARLAT